MNYVFPTEITNSVCAYLSSDSVLYNYPSRRTRQVWVRSGSKWYKQSQNTTSYDQDLSNYSCIRDFNSIEYEYSFIEPVYQIIGGVVAMTAITLAFWLIIYRFFKGGHKW